MSLVSRQSPRLRGLTDYHRAPEQLPAPVLGALDPAVGAVARVALVAPRAALLRTRVAVRHDVPESRGARG